jgi:intracellular septation protein A
MRFAMMIFLVLAPFGSFSLLMLVTSAPVALFAAAAICLAVIAYDVIRGRSIKMLGAGSVVLFGALGCYITLVDSSLSSSAVKLTVDAGVFAIALLSIAFRVPFTLQYAREMVDPKTAKQPGFMAANYIISWAWAGAFVAMMAANILMIYTPSLPLWTGIAIVFAARNSAAYFTKWYPQYRKAKYATPATTIGAA